MIFTPMKHISSNIQQIVNIKPAGYMKALNGNGESIWYA